MSHPIAAAIDGLIAAWRAAPSLAYDRGGTQVALDVVDGPPLDDPDAPRVLYVGVGADYTPAGAQGQVRHGYGARTETATDVACQLLCWTGEADPAMAPALVRTQALDVIDELAHILAGDVDLGESVSWARIVQIGYEPRQGLEGAAALIPFTVRVDATRFEGA